MMPSVLPRTSREPAADLSQPPWCAETDLGNTPRISMTISAIVNSATLRVLENGALKTGTPLRCAAVRSTWLVPTEKQPMAIRLSATPITSSVSWVRERMPSRCTPPRAFFRAGPSSAFGRRSTLT